MIVIGLTGGIATGKSTVARHLASLGARVVDADQLGHRSYAPGGPAHRAVIEAFGPDIVAADGSIDRRALGARVFADPGELQRLSAIVWPQIGALLQQELRRIAREAPEAVVVIEAAVLLEAGWTGELDELWVVVADRETATRRALSRGGLDVEAVRARMAAQLSNEQRAARADLVLDNSGDLPGLLAQVESAWRRPPGRVAGGRRRVADRNTEATLNDALARGLRELRKRLWHSSSSEVRGYLQGRQPDILIRIDPGSHAIIETELAGNPDRDAVQRLQQCIEQRGNRVNAVVALNWPARFAGIPQSQLDAEIRRAADFDVAFHQRAGTAIERYPEQGFISLDLPGLAAAVDQIAQPLDAIEQAASILDNATENVAAVVAESGGGQWANVTEILRQKEDADGKLHRMAASIVANALLFQESIAQLEHSETGEPVRHIAEMLDPERIQKLQTTRLSATIEHWNFILQINYWPIFEIAKNLISGLPTGTAGRILEILSGAVAQVVDLGASASHDFTGLVFQKLIADRKQLAAFYTLPASAEFLAEWCFPGLPGDCKLRVADFACGTGTLLSAACRRSARELLETQEVAREDAYRDVMERMATGLDVLPPAVHLTASLLSSMSPKTTYGHSNIHLMPYGKVEGLPGLHIGSLGMLKKDQPFSVGGMAHAPDQVSASPNSSMAGKSGDARLVDAEDNSFDWIVMNPPFTRNTNHAAARAGIPMPAFAGMENSEAEQRAMTESLKRIYTGRAKPYAHSSNAGLATPFIDLAYAKLKPGGALSMILPLSLANAQDWSRARATIAHWFTDVKVAAIRQGHPGGMSFSASTGMGECILSARKRDTHNGPCRRPQQPATAVVLHEPPRIPLRAVLAALQIQRGAPGDAATVFEFEIHDDGRPWGTVTTDDPELLEMAAELMSGQINGCELPMTSFSEIGFLGPYAFDILGTEKKPDGLHRGPFEKRLHATPGVRPRYHSLWNHDHKLEQALERRGAWTHSLSPRKHRSARLQEENQKRLRKIWKLRSHIHWNQDFRFNSQATSCIHTATATLGGSAWPGCHFHQKDHAIPFLLWMNSTLGMLAYWHQSSRQQKGRGRIAFKAAALVPVFDFRTLRKRQIEKATALFKELKRNPMRPLNEIDEDENRKLLDELFYREVLNLPAELHEPGGFLDTLRAKLAREPSIQGGKRPK